MAGLSASMLFLGVLLVAGCGSAADGTRVEPEAAKPTEQRDSVYTTTNVPGGTPCGFIEMPNHGTEYVPCPSEGIPSPISDSPANDGEFAGPPPGFDPRPEPPGDPPPM